MTKPLLPSLLLFLVACSAPATGDSAQTVVHRDPRGLTITTPRGWTVTPDARTAKVEIRIPGGSRAVLWPSYANPGVSVSPDAVLAHLAGLLWPGASWRPATVAVRGEAHRSGTLGDQRINAVLVASRSAKGTAMTLYAVEAPANDFSRIATAVATAFESAAFVGEPNTPGPRGRAPAYVRWTDPNERAFSVDVPRGWAVTGGVVRKSQIDVRPLVEARSPDGTISVRIGAPELPSFVEYAFPMAGNPSIVVRPLPTARAFVGDYVRTAFAAVCPDLQVGTPVDRPELAAELNALYQRYELWMRIRAADTEFTCGPVGKRIEGYTYAGLEVTRTVGPAMWKAAHVFTALAAQGRSASANSVLAHIVGSFGIEPEWGRRNLDDVRRFSEITSKTNDAISNMIIKGHEARTAIMDDIDRRRSNAILEIEDVRDADGTLLRVESGPNHHWIDVTGNILGTDIDATPAFDARKLTVW
jgi:hypothetical protein